MPPRLVSLGILVFWAVSASSLLVRDVLPDLLVGPPPDLRDIARAGERDASSRWTLLVGDPVGDPGDLRAVGQATTETTSRGDGHVRFGSTVTFDAGALLEQTPLRSAGGERLEVTSVLDVDGSGNLSGLRSEVRVEGDEDSLLVLEGHLEDDSIAITARGPMLIFGKRTFRFPYQARGMVQNAMAPLDRIPGLHVGQRWESRVVSPLTGRVEVVHVEVTDRNVMVPWGDELVPTFLLVSRMNTGMGEARARTWARASDGLVLRQEVPLVLVTLMLERQP
ncbi:hypothetical protein [Tautonia plasticadhaerens]|uniref:Uncharacterized protein n=1 Tax=Tautonia plasticadhaerens TaxID=2527974 RepID=A0A518H0E4_9BACT|nr:hypothetical protein [Tautonia plasticadhaerens]QDV34306.1 hypothetical protein ElP_21910 [Tautonia plasticadhaerens]